MIENEVKSWTDAIVHFFENEIKKSELFKAKEAYLKKIGLLKAEKDQKKKEKLEKEVEQKEHHLKELRKLRISDDIKTLIFEWGVKNKAPYVIPSVDKYITKVTHPLKFSHSADLNTGICDETTIDMHLISTAAIKNKVYDLTHHNGAIIQLVRFFGVSYNNEIIYDLILKADFSFLNDFNLSSDDKVIWKNQFRAWVEKKGIKTTGRAKQIYFPINDNNAQQYDLLVPLHSSTLSFEIYSRAYVQRFSLLRREVKYKYDTNKYSNENLINYPHLAAIEYGNGQPQNISLLNTSMNGFSYLLPCSSPKYKKVTKPLLDVKTVFDQRAFGTARVKDTLTYMSDFLVRFSSLNLSMKDDEKSIWLERWCDQVIEEFFQYVYELHELSSGWTADKKCKLVLEYQLLLDPYRSNLDFREKIKSNTWHPKIINEFAFWLNRTLELNNDKFTGTEWHLSMWRKRLAPELRNYADEIKHVIKMEGAVG